MSVVYCDSSFFQKLGHLVSASCIHSNWSETKGGQPNRTSIFSLHLTQRTTSHLSVFMLNYSHLVNVNRVSLESIVRKISGAPELFRYRT